MHVLHDEYLAGEGEVGLVDVWWVVGGSDVGWGWSPILIVVGQQGGKDTRTSHSE